MTNHLETRVLDALLMPLRLPGRVVADIETVAHAVKALQNAAEVHLASVDKRVGVLVGGVIQLQETVTRLERAMAELTGLEATIESQMEGLREDLNKRMHAVETEVHGMRPPLDQMARDVQAIGKLLPDPRDGPLARLRDTLTPS